MRTASSVFALVAAFAAADAGRVGESSFAEAWVATELLEETTAPSLPCAQSAPSRPRELVFEMLELSELEAETPQALTASSREIVAFEWNAATGLLTFSTTAPTSVFGDLDDGLPSVMPAVCRAD